MDTNSPKAFRWTEYDPRTDLISPVGRTYRGSAISLAIRNQFGWSPACEVLNDALVGWEPFTALVRFDGSAIYALVS